VQRCDALGGCNFASLGQRFRQYAPRGCIDQVTATGIQIDLRATDRSTRMLVSNVEINELHVMTSRDDSTPERTTPAMVTAIPHPPQRSNDPPQCLEQAWMRRLPPEQFARARAGAAHC
jgi:hypothetical protein